MVGLGDTKKKLQRMIDAAEDLYGRMNDLRAEVDALRDTVESTDETVAALDAELARQRALLEALAADAGVDPEAVLEEASVDASPEKDSGEGTADRGEASDAAGGSAADPED
ncbi:MAG: DUF5798 family protein [Halorientalis sp.]